MKNINEQESIFNHTSSVWVTASAGSGKTNILIERIIKLLVQGVIPSQIMCLTFTKAASIEMYERVTSQLFEWLHMKDDELRKILEKYGASRDKELSHFRSISLRILEEMTSVSIQTIHSFCENILKKFPIESGLSPNFSIIEPGEAESYLIEARNLTFKKYQSNEGFQRSLKSLVIKNDERRFNDLLTELISRKITLNKIWSNKNEISKIDDYLYVFFNLEKKDTFDSLISESCNIKKEDYLRLSELVKYLLMGSEKDKAKAEALDDWLKRKVDRRKNWETYKSIFLTKKNTILKNIISKQLLDLNPELLNIINLEAKRVFDIEEKIEFLSIKNKIMASLTVFKYIMIEYQKIKSKSNVLDYDDLILYTLGLFSKKDISPWVLFKFDQQIKHFLVDEAQDTSREQWDLLYNLITEISSVKTPSDYDKTIFIVGDYKQSIFSFQGAEPELLSLIKNKFYNFFKKKDHTLEVMPLTKSYRSVSVILNFVDKIFSENEDLEITEGKKKWEEHKSSRSNEPGLIELWPLQEKYSNTRNIWDLPLNQVNTMSSESELAKLISSQIKEWLQNGEVLKSKNRVINPGDIMVLVRRRGLFFDKIIQELKKNEIPVVSSDKIKLKDYLIVKDLIKLVEFVLLPGDDFVLANVLKGPLFNLNDQEIFTISNSKRDISLWDSLINISRKNTKYEDILSILRGIISMKSNYSPFDFYSEILNTGGKQKFLSIFGNENSEIIDEFLNQVLAYEESNIISFQGFIDWFENTSMSFKIDLGNIKDKVRVLTVHSSKGLESEVVFLPDTTSVPINRQNSYIVKENSLTFIMFPSSLSGNESSNYFRVNSLNKKKEYKEYLRLFYVAMTRARDRLYICGYKQTRNIDKGSWYALAERAFEQTRLSFKKQKILGGKNITVNRIES